MLNYSDHWNFDDPVATRARFVELLEQYPEFRAETWTQIARTHSLRREFVEAEQALENSVSATASPDYPARYRLEKGRIYNSSGRKELAVPEFTQAVEAAESSQNEALVVDALHMLAIADDPSRALDWNVKAIARAEASAQPEARKWLGSLLNNLGWTHFSNGDHEQALECFERAVLARQPGTKTHTIARWCVGRALRELGRTDEALALQLELVSGQPTEYVFEELAILTRRSEYATKALSTLLQDDWFVENEPARIQLLKEIATGI